MNSKILFVTCGPIEFGSSRLRAFWPASYLGANVLTYKDWQAGVGDGTADIFIFQKSADGQECRNLRAAGKQVWWDVCDPVWWFEPVEARAIADAVTGVVASSQSLMLDFNRWYGAEKAVTIPDRLELSHYGQLAQHGERRVVRIVWFGAAQNRFSLLGALAPLERLTANGYHVEITIMDDHPEEVLRFTNRLPVYHTLWQLDREVEILAAHDLALLPPYPGPWGRVKSNNKMLTAWACGLPVATGEFYEHLELLVRSADERKRLGEAGRLDVEANWQVEQSAGEWRKLLCV